MSAARFRTVEAFANREGLGVEGMVEGVDVAGRPPGAAWPSAGYELPAELEAARTAAESPARPRSPPPGTGRRARSLRRGRHREADVGGGRLRR